MQALDSRSRGLVTKRHGRQGADIEQLALGRGHRTLAITREGGKVVTIPLAPRAARADPRATIRHYRARGSLGRHATHTVAACIAGAAR